MPPEIRIGVEHDHGRAVIEGHAGAIAEAFQYRSVERETPDIGAATYATTAIPRRRRIAPGSPSAGVHPARTHAWRLRPGQSPEQQSEASTRAALPP
jgi:hypothetical protein